MVIGLKESMKIGMLVRMLNNSLAAQYDKDMKEIDLTSSQGNILGYLIFNEGREVNQKDIEKEFKLMNPTVTGILKRLERKGFIVREKSKDDARYNIVKLTEKGRKIPHMFREKAMEVDKRLLKGFSEAEINFFERILKRLIENITK